MKRIANVLCKLSWGERAYAVFALCATTASALPAQTLTTLHTFDFTDGQAPSAALVQATDGDFYGTTFGGGSNENRTVFKITRAGTLTTLYNFCSQSGCTDGAYPYAGLVQDTNGDFYGTTESGGANGGGTVFKVTPSGELTTLYDFCNENVCPVGAGEYPSGASSEPSMGTSTGQLIWVGPAVMAGLKAVAQSSKSLRMAR